MKSLVEKIIDNLSQKAKEHGNPIVIETLKHSIEEIKQLEEEAEFEEVARIVVKHLNNPIKYHPHHTVVITNISAELSEGKMSIGKVLDYVVD